MQHGPLACEHSTRVPRTLPAAKSPSLHAGGQDDGGILEAADGAPATRLSARSILAMGALDFLAGGPHLVPSQTVLSAS